MEEIDDEYDSEEEDIDEADDGSGGMRALVLYEVRSMQVPA